MSSSCLAIGGSPRHGIGSGTRIPRCAKPGGCQIGGVRQVTSLGLKEAKEVVDSAPKTVKDGVSKDEAAEIKKTFEAEGAKVEIK